MLKTTPLTAEDIAASYGENHQITGEYDKNLAVKCINGTFVGKNIDGILTYKGIPFVGEQPVGKNRFKAPIDYIPCDSVFEAYYNAKVQPQDKCADEAGSYYPQSEDSLYLNIWSNARNKDAKKPVMVWIHGGGFGAGSTADPSYDGNNFVEANDDVILCSIAYRVGMLGFLRLTQLPDGTEYNTSQNNGLLDQVQALKWIYENISGFGGDPENITIFGESAGAGSVALLPQIPEARKYIKRVIAESGGPVFTRSTQQALDVSNEQLELLGVKTVAEALKAPIEKIVELNGQFGLRGWPERDGIIIPENPYAELGKPFMKDIDFMHGCNKDETNYFNFAFGSEEACHAFFAPRIKALIASLPEDLRAKAQSYVDECPFEEGWERTCDLGDQIDFFGPHFRMSEERANCGGNTYQYYYKVESEFPHIGSCHAIELQPVFNNNYARHLMGRAVDDDFCKIMQRFWVNFAKCGNPSIPAEESPTGKAIIWSPYQPEDKWIMVMDEDEVAQSNTIDQEMIDWDRMYPVSAYYTF